MKIEKKFDLMNSISWKNEFRSHEIRPHDHFPENRGPNSCRTHMGHNYRTYCKRGESFCVISNCNLKQTCFHSVCVVSEHSHIKLKEGALPFPKKFPTPLHPPPGSLVKTLWTLPMDFQTVCISMFEHVSTSNQNFITKDIYQYGSSWLTMWRMSPLWNGSPASLQGMYLSSVGS